MYFQNCVAIYPFDDKVQKSNDDTGERKRESIHRTTQHALLILYACRLDGVPAVGSLRNGSFSLTKAPKRIMSFLTLFTRTTWTSLLVPTVRPISERLGRSRRC